MYRYKRIIIRLSKDEHDIVNKLAQFERLPISTMTRRLLLKEASEQNIPRNCSSIPETGGNHARQCSIS